MIILTAVITEVVVVTSQLKLPYSGKVWRGKSLANLANCL